MVSFFSFFLVANGNIHPGYNDISLVDANVCVTLQEMYKRE